MLLESKVLQVILVLKVLLDPSEQLVLQVPVQQEPQVLLVLRVLLVLLDPLDLQVLQVLKVLVVHRD